MASKYQKDIEELKLGVQKVELLLSNHLVHHQEQEKEREEIFRRWMKYYIPLLFLSINTLLAITMKSELGLLDFLKHALSLLFASWGS